MGAACLRSNPLSSAFICRLWCTNVSRVLAIHRPYPPFAGFLLRDSSFYRTISVWRAVTIESEEYYFYDTLYRKNKYSSGRIATNFVDKKKDRNEGD